MIPSSKRIPVTVLTGFLGAGKTTFLNHLLKDVSLKDTAVIVNEFGEVGIDHLLVETAAEGIIELSDGCLCCTMRGDLLDTLAHLIDRLQTGRLKQLERVIIETTGLADPAPILQAVIGHPIMQSFFEIDGVITLVDAVNAAATLDKHEEALRQIAFADRLLITKTDLLDNHALSKTLIDKIKKLNSTAKLYINDEKHLKPQDMIGIDDFALEAKLSMMSSFDMLEHEEGHHHHHDVNRHDDTIRAFSLLHDGTISYRALEAFIDILRATMGAQILRMKGIVALSEDPSKPVIIHGVQTVFHPPIMLEKWPDENRQTRLVLITDSIDEKAIRDMFDAFLSKPSIDTADRQAMMENPLAIPGLKF
ncbi:CobW family GTP-binding protein [Bartonella tamiae]|uniref:CobW C-terminal domain-containing protein n=1 Tax=Bartonella tamiae Th239 TaxID=1094558 RepID=J0ZS51_9HYPH|nr:GTP-binding protein [Bartonella tamiae]EJF91553.1 hypothetical protein ME5_00248 [Bartonella tamiae Th239]EJF92463.1 hypothetical protein MEG_01633 [Bartonella tamiae Th307]